MVSNDLKEYEMLFDFTRFPIFDPGSGYKA